MSEPRPDSRLALASIVLGGLCVVLALSLALMAAINRTLRARIAEGQAQVSKAQTLANLDNSLVQLLAKSAVDNNDLALRDLLSRNGVTFKQGAQTAPADNAQKNEAPHDKP